VETKEFFYQEKIEKIEGILKSNSKSLGISIFSLERLCTLSSSELATKNKFLKTTLFEGEFGWGGTLCK